MNFYQDLRTLFKNKFNKKFFLILFFFSAMTLVSAESSGTSASTIGDIASNMMNESPPLFKLVTVAGYITGISFMISGLVKFKAHKETPQQVPLLAPIIFVFIGASLFYFHSTISVLTYTFLTEPSGPKFDGKDPTTVYLIDGKTAQETIDSLMKL